MLKYNIHQEKFIMDRSKMSRSMVSDTCFLQIVESTLGNSEMEKYGVRVNIL